jgi:heme/copper-type cytochrome/quinol oxidase subunit 4
MFSKFFQNSEWMNIFAVVTMIVFIVAFVVIIIWVMKMDKNELEEQRNLPFKD